MRNRSVKTRGQLTAQEMHIARLAKNGLSNPEIGAGLFITATRGPVPLGQCLTKLAISSRSQLDRVLPREPTTAQAQ